MSLLDDQSHRFALHRAAATVFYVGLLFTLTAPVDRTFADVPNPTVLSSDAEKKAAGASQAGDDALLAELRDKRQRAEAELNAVSQPATLGHGAPPGMPQEELLERRSLLQQIARGYDEQIDDLQRLKEAQQRHEEISRTSQEWKGFPESPPYPVFLADQLWDTLFSLRLAAEGLESQLGLIALRFDRARDALKTAEERLRQASERLEATTDPAQASRQRWIRDLEDLRRRAASVAVNGAESSKKRVEQELADTQARLAFESYLPGGH